MEVTYTAVVHKRVRVERPVLNSRGKQVLLGPNRKPLPIDEKTGEQVGSGTPQVEIIETPTIDNPLTDEAGNVVESGSAHGILRAVRSHFKDFQGEIEKVIVRETRTVQEVSGEELQKQ